jgi:excisionase family DNA binding protein
MTLVDNHTHQRTNLMSPLLLRKDVAALLRVSQRTVTRLLAGGRLASVRVGGQVRVRLEDVDAYLAAQQTTLYRPHTGFVVSGADFVNGLTALVPAEQPADGTYGIAHWACDNIHCGVRDVILMGRASARPAPVCPACREPMRLVGHLAELLLVPVKGAGVETASRRA